MEAGSAGSNVKAFGGLVSTAGTNVVSVTL